MNSFRLDGARVEVWHDLTEVNERASELIIGIAREAVSRNGEFTIALSGGSTPRALYELLATDSKRARIPWPETHVFWTDERCVPPTDPQSNYRMAHEALLESLNLPSSQVHRMLGEDEPQHAADSYADDIKKHFGNGDPHFSLVLLGMGDDGHTASLFPDSPALSDTTNLVAANYVDKLAAHRLTLTFRALNAAAMIIFLVSGEAKASALNAVLGIRNAKDGILPASLVRPSRGELLWLVDEPAAKFVDSRS